MAGAAAATPMTIELRNPAFINTSPTTRAAGENQMPWVRAVAGPARVLPRGEKPTMKYSAIAPKVSTGTATQSVRKIRFMLLFLKCILMLPPMAIGSPPATIGR
jgi:hypothetical protein